jgi:kynurenine formamidase
VRLIDLSAPIRPDPPEFPDALRTDIEFEDHSDGARMIETLFGVESELLHDREGWATETFLRFGTQTPPTSTLLALQLDHRGEPARTIDQLPLEWFYAPGVVIDATDRGDGEVLTADDVEERPPKLNDLDIVLVRTGRDASMAARVHGSWAGVSAEATSWLYEQGVRVMGIDAWGWDAPLWMQAEEAKKTGKPGVFWAAHQVDLDYSQIERLCNLGALPDEGFQVACFPLRLEGGSAAPARVVAILP